MKSLKAGMKSYIKATAEVHINVPVSKVWDALTKPEIIKQYFFNTNTSTEWKVGGPIRFSGEHEGKGYVDKGTILAFEPKKLIKYKYWSSMSGLEDKPENYQTITYEVSEQEGGTKLVIAQEDIHDENVKEHSEQNWKKVLANLKTLLEESGQVAAY